MPSESSFPVPPGTVINKENFNEIAKAILAGASFFLTAAAPTGYTRQFQHKDWTDFVDPVQAGGSNGFNGRFHALETEFDLISKAITSVDDAVTALQTAPPAIGITMVRGFIVGSTNVFTIPTPSGFLTSETLFFAIPVFFSFPQGLSSSGGGGGGGSLPGHSVEQVGGGGGGGGGEDIGFDLVTIADGTVHMFLNGGATGLVAIGIGIAKKGGWG